MASDWWTSSPFLTTMAPLLALALQAALPPQELDSLLHIGFTTSAYAISAAHLDQTGYLSKATSLTNALQYFEGSSSKCIEWNMCARPL